MLWLKFLITCRPCGDPAAGMWRSQDTPGVGRPALGTSPWLGSCGEASSISNSVHHPWTCNQQGRKSRRGTCSCFVSLCVSTSVGRDRQGGLLLSLSRTGISAQPLPLAAHPWLRRGTQDPHPSPGQQSAELCSVSGGTARSR